jgi:hypothetical protein
MKKWWSKFYKENKPIIWAFVIGVILSLGVLLKVKDEVTRFTLIMPIFAGFILFSILITADEDLEDEKEDKEEEDNVLKKTSKKKTSKK